MPLLWAAIFAIICNLLHIEFAAKTEMFLEYGAHASITIQLYLFGLFLAEIRLKKISLFLNTWVNVAKFLLLPAFGFFLLFIVSDTLRIPPVIQGVFLLELIVPLAINNANLARLYHSCSTEAAEVVFTSTLLFLICTPLFFLLF